MRRPLRRRIEQREDRVVDEGERRVDRARDLAAFREAVRNDDGQRVSLADLRAELND